MRGTDTLRLGAAKALAEYLRGDDLAGEVIVGPLDGLDSESLGPGTGQIRRLKVRGNDPHPSLDAPALSHPDHRKRAA